MKKNVFFFKDAASNFGSIQEYTKELMKVCSSEEELYTMLSEQIFIESEIITVSQIVSRDPFVFLLPVLCWWDYL